MADHDKITYEEFIAAVEIVAVVIGDDLWHRFRDELPALPRPATDSAWLDSNGALKYVGFGETKFRQLVKAGDLPAGRKIGGKLMWSRTELNQRMAKLFRNERRALKGDGQSTSRRHPR